MPNLTSVTLTAGIPTAGSGVVSTLDQVMANGVPLTDGTNKATVKPAATAPVDGDTGAVVHIHPRSLNANGVHPATGSAPVVNASDNPTLSVAMDTSVVTNGDSSVRIAPTKTRINITTAGTVTLVPIQAGKKIRILSMYLIATQANTINLQSHVTTTNSDGLPGYAANGGMVLPFNPIGWFDTTVGEALDMVTTAAPGQVSGQFSWIPV